MAPSSSPETLAARIRAALARESLPPVALTLVRIGPDGAPESLTIKTRGYPMPPASGVQ